MRGAFVLLLAALVGCGRRDDGALPLGSGTEDCAMCHADHAGEHTASAHGHAATSPLVAALLPGVEEAWGEGARDACVGCHAPDHAPDRDPGVTCVSCHAAVGSRRIGDGQLVLDRGAPLAGTLSSPVPTPAHRSARRDLLGDATLCLTCHDVRGPGLVHEPSVDEYAFARAAVGAPTCIACHMPQVEPRRLTDDTPLRASRRHGFQGLTPVPGMSVTQREEGLRALFAGHVALELEWVDAEHVNVRLRNVDLGHDLPTGAAWLRDVWVEVTFVGPDGIASRERVLTLGDRVLRGAVEVPLLHEGERTELDRLRPGSERVVTVRVGPETVTVSASLRVRAARPQVVARLEGNLAPEVRAALEQPFSVLEADLRRP